MSACHCGTNMTEVAAVDAHDVEDKESDVTANDVEGRGERASTEDQKPRGRNETASNETDKTHVNGLEHKEKKGQNESSGDVNGVSPKEEDEEEEEPETNEDQNISDVAFKKEVRWKTLAASLHFWYHFFPQLHQRTHHFFDC